MPKRRAVAGASPTRRKWTCPKCGTLFEWVTAPKCLACGYSVDGRKIQKGTDFGGGLLVGSGGADEGAPLRPSALADPYDLDEMSMGVSAVLIVRPDPPESLETARLAAAVFVIFGVASAVGLTWLVIVILRLFS